MAGKSNRTAIESRNSRFDALLAQLRRRGDLMLPPERRLCEALGCSRNTARKLLQERIASGAIVKKRFGYTLSMETAANKKFIGAFTFIASGDSLIGNPAWAKLWNALQPLAEAAGIGAETLLLHQNKAGSAFENLERDVLETAVVTTLDGVSLNAVLALKGRTLITAEEHYRGAFRNIAALDNFKAGYLAAQALARHGYERPAMISHDLTMPDGALYVQYERRVEGFKEGCLRFGLKFSPGSLLKVAGNAVRVKIDIAKHAAELRGKGFDSVFLHTDGELDFLMEGLASSGAGVPQDIGVITLNSSDNAVRFSPPATSVSHATKPVAEALLEMLKTHFATGSSDLGERLMAPEIHEGASLK